MTTNTEQLLRDATAANVLFEAWATKQGYDLTREDGVLMATYRSGNTEHAWRGYCHHELTQPAPVGEPDAYLHDDGFWTAAKTYAGRQLNDRLLFAGSPKIGVYTTPPASQEQAARYLIRARWPDGIEQYLDVNNVTDLGGKIGIDVDVPMVHPLTASQEQQQQPSGGEVVAWRLRASVGSCGLQRFLTQAKYEKQTPAIKKWYEPFKCQNCATTKPEPMTAEQIVAIAATPCAIPGSYVYSLVRAVEAHHGITTQAKGGKT